jgi:hypothetical protein
MKNYFRLFYIFILFNFNFCIIHCQSISDTICNPKIKSVQIYKDGWELSYPVIALNSNEKLKISFDDLNTNLENYNYTIEHCNSNWEPSAISNTEVFDGFDQNQIIDRQFSINTTISYIHYSFDIPNENCNPKISGNYIVKVFQNSDESKILFTKRFYITEYIANIDLSIIRPEIPKYMARDQQYKISIIPNLNDYTDLRSEIKTFIMQNYNENSRKECYLSRIENSQTMIYDDPDSNIFAGSNEYRAFDIKSKKYQSEHIRSIKYDSSSYIITLTDDDWRNQKQYFTEVDLNGNYFINNSDGSTKDIDADYFKIKFTLPTLEPVIDGNLYIFGALTNWECNSNSILHYNLDKSQYECQLLLKQGYYNYLYAYKTTNNNKIDLSYVERNHYETENDYLVFVYYKAMNSRYERLIGYKIANSVKKTD